MTETCPEKLGSGGPCSLMETHQQQKLGVLIIYDMEEEAGKLILVGGLCRGAVSSCSHLDEEAVVGSFCTHWF